MLLAGRYSDVSHDGWMAVSDNHWLEVRGTNYVIQPRSCIALGGNTSLQLSLKSCTVNVHRAGESDGNP